MSGLMARIRSRRADGSPTAAEQSEGEAPVTEPTAAGPDAAAGPAPDGVHDAQNEATTVIPAVDRPAEGDQPTAVIVPITTDAPAGDAPTAEAADTEVPAGADPAPSGPSFRDRGKLRRRLRYVRRVRELGFRDLGGLVFDLDRFGREKPELVRAKLDALGAIDRELRSLEAALHDERPVEELQEPGVAACAHCGALHGSDARFCPSCGRPAGSVPEPEPEAPAQAETPAGE